MISINTKQVLVNFKNEPLKVAEEELTVGTAISLVLSGQVSNPTLGYILAKKFANDNSVDLKAEDVVFIKKEMTETKHWTAIVSGQILSILDGDTASATVSKQ